ncbi:hypothetical protein DNTS_008332 [Danionella cerebrum]|uniref:Sterile alpha motif domain-containing protein 14 n=1 Tax=Danionella cerebrum TaxID=2873325 RepID=A0A553R0T6_9TELE|nr:hypothetical protein DNTS_008332 [Danionella translucida]
MSSTPLAEAEEDVFDLTEAVPETERLDSSLQKAKAQLSIKTRRHRPSRTRLRDSVCSIDGDDSFEKLSYNSSIQTSSSPLHPPFNCSSPSSDLLLSSPPSRRDRAFTFDPCAAVGEREVQDERMSYRHLLSASSQETLPLTPLKSPSRPCVQSETSSPAHLCQTEHLKIREGSQPLLHYGEYSQSEDDSHDTGPDEPESPTVLLDKKTRRRFLDLGVTLRRTYGKVRKDRSNRLSAGNRDSERTENRSSRSSGPPFVPFSWFSDRLRGSGSPKTVQSPSKPFVQNDCESTRGPDFSFKKKMLSAAGKDKAERQNGVHGKRETGKNGHGDDGQKLLTS